MKFWKKGLTAAALLAVTAVTLTACGGSSEKKATEKSEDGKTKLTVTAPDGSQKVFDAAKAEETAYIQAQRTAAAKTQAAATALKEQQETQNELARLQELLDRQTRIADDAQKALDNLKLRSISPTA
ncbi:MAG: hypothetical protein E7D77_04525, partial [Enterococcus faecalis]|nr:hypothetical protein [Enterococcus faecalis]